MWSKEEEEEKINKFIVFIIHLEIFK